jgi:hypothetical protein
MHHADFSLFETLKINIFSLLLILADLPFEMMVQQMKKSLVSATNLHSNQSN